MRKWDDSIFNIILLDDNLNYLNGLEKFINDTLAINKMEARIVLKTPYPFDVEKYIEENTDIKGEINVYFLDIELKDGEYNGYKLAEKIRKKDVWAYIIFITGYSEYMSVSFFVEPFRFFVKPITKDKIQKCLMDLSENYILKSFSKVTKKTISITSDYEKREINVNDIIYIERNGRHSIIYTTEDNIYCGESLTSLQEKIKDYDFEKCHKSYLVNKNYIYKIDLDKQQLMLKTNDNKYYTCGIRKNYKFGG